MVTVTGVAALLGLTRGGEKEQVAPAGRPEHVYVTRAVKALAPTGVSCMEVDVDWPACAAGGAERVVGTLISVFTARLTECVCVIVPSLAVTSKL
jgi:hypothetical protein